MNKFYSLLAIAAVCTTSVTAVNTLKVSHQSADLKTQLAPAKIKSGITSTLRDASIVDAGSSLQTSQTPAKAPAKAPTGSWTSIGTGSWVEGPLDFFTDIESGQIWEVDIETNDQTPGWYRILPYASENCPIAQLIGMTDTSNYVYINATDPSKVYVEPYSAYGIFQMCQLVPENKATLSLASGYSEYGTLENKTISFPAESFAYMAASGGVYYANTDGKFKIYLPGAEIKDYELSITTPFCGDKNVVTGLIDRGADIATVKFINLSGMYENSTQNASIVAVQGVEIPSQYKTLELEAEDGINTILYVGLDSDGNIVAAGEDYYIGTVDSPEEWTSIGEGSFDEGIYSSGYSDIDLKTVTVEVQKHKTTEGLYRLVNPYSAHPDIKDYTIEHEGHNHYIIINATDPDHVYLECSAVGVDLSGEGAVWSVGGSYLDGGNTIEDIETYIGKVFGKKDGNEITMPDNSLYHAEKEWQKGAFLKAGESFKVTLPSGSSGIANVSAVANNAPVEYFNLQGVRVNNPAAGQLVIKRQGSEVTKTIIR